MAYTIITDGPVELSLVCFYLGVAQTAWYVVVTGVYLFCVRVQQEQLAAIFQLLRANQEALEVTEGEMEEQLKLYTL